MAKKPNIEEIDENFIINSFRQDDLTFRRRRGLRNYPTGNDDLEPTTDTAGRISPP